MIKGVNLSYTPGIITLFLLFGEFLALKGSMVEIAESQPHGSVLGHAVFEANHCKTKQTIYITQEDISR